MRLQSGIQRVPLVHDTPQTNGLLLKGVVMATYVTDDDNHPAESDNKNQPVAVYCDVAVYPSIARNRWYFYEKVLVSQSRGGLHDDDSWKPKATKTNIVTQVLDNTVGSNPGQLDGDHVLIGFLNNSYEEPIILRGIPHPMRDVGNELYSTGKRLKLKQVDGNPDFKKHNGVFRGVDGTGNHVIDSTFGNDGELLAAGIEPPPDTTGTSGNQNRKLPADSSHEITFWNMDNPVTPVEVSRFECANDVFHIQLETRETLEIKEGDEDATLILGDGAVSAAIAERLETLWRGLKYWLDTHVHPTGTGPSGVSVPASPGWHSDINSEHLTFPDNEVPPEPEG